MSRHRSILLAAAAIAAVAAALATLVLVDEDLTPEARNLYDRPPRPFVRDSGWAYLAGFDAPAGVDPRDHAMGTPREIRELRAKNAPRTARGDELAVRAAPELLCQPQTQDCVRSFADHPRRVDAMAEDNALLLARYDELLGTSGLADASAELDSPDAFHPGAVLLGIQRVRLSQIGAAAARGRLDQALAWLEADATFHRRWLGEARTILSKMLALRTFTRTVAVAAQVARAATELSPGQARALERITAPLSRRERGVAETIRTEAISFSHAIAERASDSPTLRRNATLNFAAPLYASWMRLDEVESTGLAAAIEHAREAERTHLEPGWRWAINHSGRSLVADGHYDMARYVYRLRDGEALASMLRCAVRLRTNRVAEGSAPEFIAGDPGCRDPYVGRPFDWDATRGALSFEPREEQSVVRYGGGNGRVTFAPYPR